MAVRQVVYRITDANMSLIQKAIQEGNYSQNNIMGGPDIIAQLKAGKQILNGNGFLGEKNGVPTAPTFALMFLDVPFQEPIGEFVADDDADQPL